MNGIDGIARIEARIEQIEAKLATVAGSAAPDFAQALRAAGAAVAPAPALPKSGAADLLRSIPPPPNFVAPLPVRPAPASLGSGVARWDPLIQKYAGQYNVPVDLVRAVLKQESDGNPRCVSHAGAMGLMQLMPANVKEAGISDAFDPEQNIKAGVMQLREHLDRYNGDVRLALAAYNAGPGNVAKYDGIPPFRETRNYVRKIMARLGGDAE